MRILIKNGEMLLEEDGELVMEDRKILTFDENEVYGKCERIAKRLGME